MATEIITPMQMYWLTRFSSLGAGLEFIVILLFIFAAGHSIVGCIMQDGDFSDSVHERGIKNIKIASIWAVVAVVFLIVRCLLPTTRDMAAILIVPRIANSEKVQIAGNCLYDLAVEWMEELRPAKNKNGGEK